ncbi:translation initiation factor infB [Acrasis kona]|uniref:Translation initiation factor infB n=1 Tax=Acrasis kona TaxID=1008807 RepID=A0AAW2YNG2_9EUKA
MNTIIQTTLILLSSIVVIANASCVQHPEVTEGPYYVDNMPYRSNITEDRQGIPLILSIRVVDIGTCLGYNGNATVEIWYTNTFRSCDAAGIYSHYEAASTGTGSQTDDKTYLRGKQYTNSSSYATFISVYPGWYTGRDTHIHMKVHINGTVVHTGQLFFNDTLNSQVSEIYPYTLNNNEVTTYDEDNIYEDGGSYGLLYPSFVNGNLAEGVVASIDIIVNPSSTSSGSGSGSTGGGPSGPSGSGASGPPSGSRPQGNMSSPPNQNGTSSATTSTPNQNESGQSNAVQSASSTAGISSWHFVPIIAVMLLIM